MNTKIKTFAIVAFTILFSSCNQTKETKKEEVDTVITEQETTKEPEVDREALVLSIDTKRTEIEAAADAPLEISTKDLREKVKQKWEKIHFYTYNDTIVRIKTYPYTAISKRTEEFYFDNGTLILAVIEDNGSGERGKVAETVDKMYYFHNEEVILEKSNELEKEYSIRNSDAEELLKEVNEYLEIFKERFPK